VEIQHGRERYSTKFVHSNVDGSAGIEVIRAASVVAKVTFWDACGQFYVETVGGDIPLAVMEAAIQEAKQLVPVR